MTIPIQKSDVENLGDALRVQGRFLMELAERVPAGGATVRQHVTEDEAQALLKRICDEEQVPIDRAAGVDEPRPGNAAPANKSGRRSPWVVSRNAPKLRAHRRLKWLF